MTELYNGLKVLMSYHRKGGVGKTFLASTIAYLLATGGPDKTGPMKRVLVLDYDAQQDSSKAFLNMEPIPGDDEYAPPRHPEYGKLDYPGWQGYNTSTDLLFNSPVVEYPTAFENIHILPSEGNVDRVMRLSEDKANLISSITKYMEQWFSIPDIAEDYDVVIVDNPPSKQDISSGILAAATHVIIPTEPEYDSIDGAPLLLNRISDINKKRPQHPLEIVGIVPNKIPTKAKQTQKDKIALTKLYNKDGPTFQYMAPFFIYRRDGYRVMDRPSSDDKHFDYVHNHHAINEMRNLYQLTLKKLWGE